MKDDEILGFILASLAWVFIFYQFYTEVKKRKFAWNNYLRGILIIIILIPFGLIAVLMKNSA
jgi:hypothetical protein